MDEKVHKSEAGPDRAFPLSSQKVLKREVYEATREARDIVAHAQAAAKQIIEEAEREREAIQAQAAEEGRAQGLAEWNQILARTAQTADELAKNWEEHMLRLSIRVAEKIIGEELRQRPETVVEIVREVLKGARPGKHLIMQVNEADAANVRAHLDRIREHAGLSSEIQVVTSPSVTRGGCTIESELGIIDARLETQLKCLEDALIRGVSAD
jgi:type III secretion protein L